MKKIVFILCSFLLINCGSETLVNNCFPGVSMTDTIDLTLAQYSGLSVPGGTAQTIISGRNVFIFRTGTSGYKAFDQQCPERNCSSLMTFDGVHIICPCDDKKYNYLANGNPIDGEGCAALMYLVTPINSNLLRITR